MRDSCTALLGVFPFVFVFCVSVCEEIKPCDLNPSFSADYPGNYSGAKQIVWWEVAGAGKQQERFWATAIVCHYTVYFLKGCLLLAVALVFVGEFR